MPKKVTFIKNLDFIRIQTRNLYIALIKEEPDVVNDIMNEIDDSILSMQDDVEQLYNALGGDDV